MPCADNGSPAQLAYDVHGPQDAPTILLGSSLGTTRAMWDPQLDALSQRLRVVRYEHRGHGASPAPNGPYDIDDLGRDVLRLLDGLGIDEFGYAGVSLGGMVGLWLAAEIPDRVRRLAVCCSSALPGGAPGWHERAATVRKDGTAAVAEPVVSRWFTPGWAADHPATVQEFTREMSHHMLDEGYAGCCEALAELDLRERLGAVAADTVVLAGADDLALPPDHSRLIADLVPQARLVIVPDAAHLATVERADLCTPLLLDHLGGPDVR